MKTITNSVKKENGLDKRERKYERAWSGEKKIRMDHREKEN